MPSTYTNLKYHLVFGTKLRQDLIVPSLEKQLYRFIGGCITEKGGVLIEINGMPEHIHILAGFRASVSVADMVHAIKGSSSRWINQQQFTEPFAWQVGYSAFSVSESNVEAVRKYIRKQKEHHQERSFEQEMKLLLKHHGISLDTIHFCT